jgi:hypothetical protein
VLGKNTSHTSHSLHSHAREMQRVPRSQTRIRVAIPRVNPGGLNPCNHLAWLACGPWRTHIQAWHGMVWYGMAWGCGLRPPPRPRNKVIIELGAPRGGGGRRWGRVRPPPRPRKGHHSQHTNTYLPQSANSNTWRATPRTRHSRFILMLATCNAYRAHRHGSEDSHSQWFTCSSTPKTPDRATGVHMDAVTTTCSSGTPGPLITATTALTTAQPSSIHRRRFSRRQLGVIVGC